MRSGIRLDTSRPIRLLQQWRVFVRGPLRLDNQRICGRRSLTGDVHGAAESSWYDFPGRVGARSACSLPSRRLGGTVFWQVAAVSASGPVADPRLARGSAVLISSRCRRGGPKMTDRSPAVRVAAIVGSVVVLLLLVALVIALLFGPLLQGGSHYG